MSQDEFEQTSPEVSAALTDRWRVRVRREAGQFASLMALIANVNRGENTPPFTAKDFLLTPSGRKRAGPTRKQRAAAADAYFKQLVIQGLARADTV